MNAYGLYLSNLQSSKDIDKSIFKCLVACNVKITIIRDWREEILSPVTTGMKLISDLIVVQPIQHRCFEYWHRKEYLFISIVQAS